MTICSCFQNIIHSSTSVGDEMTHYLYVLQTLRLNLLEHRMRTPLDSYSQVCFLFHVRSSLNPSFIFERLFELVCQTYFCKYSSLFAFALHQDQREMLHGLRQAAFEMESESNLSNERRRSLCAKEFKKLGFSVSAENKFCLRNNYLY